jgi:hypothetical protein
MLLEMIAQWHYDRNLIDGSTDKDQCLKLIQEVGELINQRVIPSSEYLAKSLDWSHDNDRSNIIWFEVTGYADGYTGGEVR